MDAIETTIFKNIFQSICDEMGKILQYSAFSPNIKERKDFSCALFTTNTESFAFGTHIPVHLGAMPLSVQAAIHETGLEEGDMVILNDPYRGGTHLPDITIIAPVFFEGTVHFYVANRAHHSDVGGMKAGSMPLASEIFQEGLIVPPVKILTHGRLNSDVMKLILSNVRTPSERKGDIMAQIAANKRGIQRIQETVNKYDLNKVHYYAESLIQYTESILESFIESIPDGSYRFSDYLDDDGFQDNPILLSVKLMVNGKRIIIDFTSSASQVVGGVNANQAITYSASLYVLTTLLGVEVPINSGIMRPVSIRLKSGSVLSAEKPAAIAGGNVETSQRITDVLLGAFFQALPERIPAGSQGTMNNISFGGKDFAYYETIGGGTGAGPGYNGISAVHSHMTNSLNTPVEAIELNFPVIIERYCIREGSGGMGKYKGGDGLIREYRFLEDVELSLLSERRKLAPYGLRGGSEGKKGENIWIKKDKEVILSGKENLKIHKNERIVIKTPGGGGYEKG